MLMICGIGAYFIAINNYIPKDIIKKLFLVYEMDYDEYWEVRQPKEVNEAVEKENPEMIKKERQSYNEYRDSRKSRYEVVKVEILKKTRENTKSRSESYKECGLKDKVKREFNITARVVRNEYDYNGDLYDEYDEEVTLCVFKVGNRWYCEHYDM